MNFKPTQQQAKVLAALQKEKRLPYQLRKKRIAVKSGQGPGKTTVTALVALWCAFQSVGAMVVVTAPSARQCRDIFLRELQRLLNKAQPILRKLVKVYATKVVICGMKGWGIDTATAVKAENIAGYHQDDLTFICEECSGIDRDIIETIKGTLSNDNALFVAIGNPTTRDCAFYDFFTRERAEWHTFTFNAEESPIVAKDNIERLAREFGRNSDVFRVRVKGQFPNMDPNCVVSVEDLEKCTQRALFDQALMACGRRQFGADLARFGDDESVLYQVRGNAVVSSKVFVKTEPGDVMDHAIVLQKEAAWGDKECVFVPDSTGLGQGVLRDLYRKEKQVHEFHNHGKPANSKDFHDKITEAYFLFARMAREETLYIPNDNRLIQQLTTRQYRITEKGKIKLESKDTYKKRTKLPSPDRADALVMAYYPHAWGGTRIAA